MKIEHILTEGIRTAVQQLYASEIDPTQVQLQVTRREFRGHFTCVVFPLVKISKKKPEDTAAELGEYLKTNLAEVADYNVIKGFLNLVVAPEFWRSFFDRAFAQTQFGLQQAAPDAEVVVVEYSSPNTNKPLHLGHIRNNLLGYAVAEILRANGYKVVKTNIVNDRGIHICKSMLAWQLFGQGATPESTGLKGDHLVGHYYVAFDKAYKAQIAELVAQGTATEVAEKEAPLMKQAQEMLRRWEAKDPEVWALWQRMNAWVYAGFDETYRKLGVDFDKIYYESDTYLLGKEVVLENLAKGHLQQRDDQSVWADLTDQGLDQKLLLRADGTSVYMTQDIGTAIERQRDFGFGQHIYVVGNEQDYHFRVLSLILQKFGYPWAQQLYHLSYGMVELPNGKMKSREGTVVDADDLIEGMVSTAREMSESLGKLGDLPEQQKEQTYRMIALAALKYFILKVDPKKTMLFNPEESVDFNGNTGPFIQYTYARIRSLLRKAQAEGIVLPEALLPEASFNEKEEQVVALLYQFPNVLHDAGQQHSPALLANYVYDLVKEYNQFYHDYSVLGEAHQPTRMARLALSEMVARVTQSAMKLLGIDMPDKM